MRHLLDFCMGFGSVMAPPGTHPIQRAVRESRIGGDGPPKPSDLPPPGEWLRRLGSLPLMYQPGERWAYNTGSDVLGALIPRVTGQSFERFLRERIFALQGMRDTGFVVPPGKCERLSDACVRNSGSGQMELFDAAVDSAWCRAPAFSSGAAGLCSTADDYLTFGRMLLNKGRHGKARILSSESVERMTSDQLSRSQRAESEIFFGDHSSWGFGMAVHTRDHAGLHAGSFGWDGGLGSTFRVDPRNDQIGILLTNRSMDSPTPPPVFNDFWATAMRATV